MQPIPRRILIAFLLLLGLGWIVLNRADAIETNGRLIPAPQVGFPSPDFTLESLDSPTITLSSLRGQPVIVNFWASWCPPCRAEMPALQAVYDEYDGQIAILAVNAANQDSLDDALTFLAEAGTTFPVLLDRDGAVNRLYAVTSLPTTFFIGIDGIISEVVVGGPLTEVGLRVRIESLLEAIP
jgi:cytochrome c biogenesis protein CcmG/thiol:disulfide interchange protein DsbE